MHSIPPSGVLELELDCERFREVASLRLDGEQTRLEAARQAEHAARCEECCAYASELAAITARIRAAPAEQPPAPVPLAMHGLLPAQKRTTRPLRHAAAALAIVLLIAAGRDDLGGPGGPAQPRFEDAYLQSIDYERQLLRAVRRPSGMRGASKAI
jgi:hypothetical protein